MTVITDREVPDKRSLGRPLVIVGVHRGLGPLNNPQTGHLYLKSRTETQEVGYLIPLESLNLGAAGEEAHRRNSACEGVRR